MSIHGSLNAVVITPSIGRRHLGRCIQSVKQQDYANVRHVVIADGSQCGEAVSEICASYKEGPHQMDVVVLPQNTGASRYNGYRICAAFSYLVNEDVIFFLDDDNWYERDHISSCISTIAELKTEWAYALRTICRADGAVMIEDNCDSLGYWRRSASYGSPANHLQDRFIDYYSAYPFLVDMNCFAIRRGLLVRSGELLLDGDGFFSDHLIRCVAGACTGGRTVNYRIAAEKEESRLEFFVTGNREMESRYLSNFPWKSRCRRGPLTLTRTRLEIGSDRCTGEAMGKQYSDDCPETEIPHHPDRPALPATSQLQ